MNHACVRKLFTPTTLALSVAGAALGSAPLALGQQQAALEEVIVTARKRQESMQDVSVAVSAFSGEQLDSTDDLFDCAFCEKLPEHQLPCAHRLCGTCRVTSSCCSLGWLLPLRI